MSEYNNECRAIVMEYLLHYCYTDTVKILLKEMQQLDSCTNLIQKETGIHVDLVDIIDNTTSFDVSNLSSLEENSIKWDYIKARKDIYESVREGNIDKAFNLIEAHFPNLIRLYNTINRIESLSSPNKSLPKAHYILYKLRCQQFIETLRTLGDIAAIQFAQTHLRPCNKIYADLTNSVTTLIAYANLENDKTRDLLSQERRNLIADEINQVLLESQNFSSQTTLEKLWRQKTVTQVELDNQKRKESSQEQKETENTEKVPM
ncbi:CTLH/CRA C-terminal to lish motif domain-containing protein [Cokeromyces recurvatus]|uniref:CTLH/CRA C-terminal to lish motif domain-containing protein n=1 Tax=Cokeromyces recurvatus TaxID=90255 RepID=UPI002220B3AE|nr:CTLH/CRA C-terminal to lish motif domain-containing protein [Cokeromyces recurvatus]KAI7899858.1 CTLH/CRA C-terminal to lish motif domain-containing protein [Cokeromyces recurvatus]